MSITKLNYKTVNHLGLVLLIWIFLAACGTQKEKANSIYFGGEILSMNGNSPEYLESVVVNEGYIVFTGNRSEAERRYEIANPINLQGKTLIPGFIEPHLHPSLAAFMLKNEIVAPYDWSIPSGLKKGIQSTDGYREMISKSIKENAVENDIYFIWGYHQLWHGTLDRTILNELSGGKPVIIIHRSFHELFMNDAAIDLVGLEEEQFIGNPHVYWDKGHFYEGGMLAVAPMLSNYLLNPDSYLKGLKEMSRLLLMNGITTIAEPGFPNVDFNQELKMLESEMANKPPYDVYLIPNGTQLFSMKGGNQESLSFIESLDTLKTIEQVSFLSKQVKLFSDGAIYSQLMQMKDGYLDGHEGEWMTPLELLKDQIELYWKEGYKIHMHANGDLGQQQVIDFVKEISEQNPREDHRFTLHHMGYFTKEMVDEMKELGMEGSVNPYYLWALSDKYTEIGLGKERAENLVAMKHLTDANIPMSFHSDFPMAPAEPLTLVWTAVNRLTSQNSEMSQSQRIDQYDALKAVTIDAARCLNLESEIGSITEGKRANFTLLKSNPLKVDPLRIKDIDILGLVYQGEEYLIN